MVDLMAHAGGWGPGIGLLWLVLIGSIVALWAWRWRGGRGGGGGGGGNAMAGAEAVLAERFARGQITEEELRRAREALREPPG